jgi:hypothetical protein
MILKKLSCSVFPVRKELRGENGDVSEKGYFCLKKDLIGWSRRLAFLT